MRINKDSVKIQDNEKPKFKKSFKTSKEIVIPLEDNKFIISIVEEHVGFKSRLLQGISENKTYAIDCNSRLYIELLLAVCKSGEQFEGKQIIVSKEVPQNIREQQLPIVDFHAEYYNHMEDFKNSILLTKKFESFTSSLYSEIDYCLNDVSNNHLEVKRQLAIESYKYKMKFRAK